ncbi:hypothetical protein [Streptomyces sp. NPDC015125]|uniref:hypothetical protein n=1 Tax=Streptomyces sp. NPDC015125 TaxID=3364938 RepID=UPI0036FEC8F9
MSLDSPRDGVTRPDWMVQAESWWKATVGSTLARNVEPLGIDQQGRLHFRCASAASGTHMRLLASGRLLKMLNDSRPTGAPVLQGIVVRVHTIPDALKELWPHLVGAVLAEEVRITQLQDWGRTLATEAATVQARDELALRAPQILARLKDALPDCDITSLSPSTLRSVSVLVATSPDFTDLQGLEQVLMDTWHDATQIAGPEHALWLEHAGDTVADRHVDTWASGVNPPALSVPLLVHTFSRKADMNRHGPDAFRLRDEALIAQHPDLCLVFTAHPDEPIRLAGLARDKNIPIRCYVP